MTVDEGREMTDDERDERLIRIEHMLTVLVDRQTMKDWYDIAEFARLAGKSQFTCREWARLDRIHAQKRRSGTGASFEWVVSDQECSLTVPVFH